MFFSRTKCLDSRDENFHECGQASLGQLGSSRTIQSQYSWFSIMKMLLGCSIWAERDLLKVDAYMMAVINNQPFDNLARLRRKRLLSQYKYFI